MATVETLGEGRFLRLVKRGAWEFVERVHVRDVAVLVPITAGSIVLVEQYRVPVQARMVELPAGLVGDEAGHEQEGLLEAAARELLEETGYRAGKLRRLGRYPSSGGMTSEIATFVEATDLVRVGPGGGVDDEEITVHVVPLSGIGRWLRGRKEAGCLLDAKIHTGLYLAGRGRPDSPGLRLTEPA